MYLRRKIYTNDCFTGYEQNCKKIKLNKIKSLSMLYSNKFNFLYTSAHLNIKNYIPNQNLYSSVRDHTCILIVNLTFIHKAAMKTMMVENEQYQHLVESYLQQQSDSQKRAIGSMANDDVIIRQEMIRKEELQSTLVQQVLTEVCFEKKNFCVL